MMNQDNLPVWAKILLSIRVDDGVQAIHSEPRQDAGSSNRETEVSEQMGPERSAMVFGTDKLGVTWSWRELLRPVASEFNS